MSAWIVENLCMDRVVTAIASDIYNGQMFDGHTTDSAEGKDEIGRALFRANYDAVGQRYSGKMEALPGQPHDHNPEGYRHTSRDVSKVQQLKSCNCLCYQMSEGDIPDSQIYKELESLINRLQSHVISDSPEYEAADWG